VPLPKLPGIIAVRPDQEKRVLLSEIDTDAVGAVMYA
jgi:hypothetical protein